MEITVLISFLLAGVCLVACLVVVAPELPEPHEPSYQFTICEYLGQPDSVDVCLYVNGCYHSLSFVWKKHGGAWKYGGERPWAGHAATKEMAIEISKRWLILDAAAAEIN